MRFILMLCTALSIVYIPESQFKFKLPVDMVDPQSIKNDLKIYK